MINEKEVVKNRFVVIHKEDVISGCKILIDKETGVSYLHNCNDNSSNLIPLSNNKKH